MQLGPHQGTTRSLLGVCDHVHSAAQLGQHQGVPLRPHRRITQSTLGWICTHTKELACIPQQRLALRRYACALCSGSICTFGPPGPIVFFFEWSGPAAKCFRLPRRQLFLAACGHASMHVCTHVWCTLLSKRSNTLRTSDQDLSKASESYFQEGSARLVGAHSFAHAEPRWSSDPKAVHIGAQLGSTSAHNSGPHRRTTRVHIGTLSK